METCLCYISVDSVYLLIETLASGTAGAGSLILEFGVLSRLTGDSRFEKAAYKAFFAIWNRKSDLGLVGNTINARTGVGMQAFLSSWLFTECISLDMAVGHDRNWCGSR